MNISSLDIMMVNAFMTPTNTIEGNIYKNILQCIYDYNYIYNHNYYQ